MPTHRLVDDVDFPSRADASVLLSQPVDVDAATLFGALTDDRAWEQWLGIRVEWTSPPGPTATRTVHNGPIAIDEQFFGWDEGERLSFCFTHSPFPVHAFVEDYRCVDLGPDRARLDWTLAADARFGLAATAAVQAVALLGRRGLPKLAELLADEPERFRPA